MRHLPGLQGFALAALALGCGARGGALAPDGGSGDALAETTVGGRRSFDVTAALGVPDGGAPAPSLLPPTNVFTLVLDSAQRRIIVGAAGVASVVPVTSSDGSTFRTTKPFSVGVASTSACSGVTSIDYGSLEITVSGTGFHGRANGSAQISCGDCVFSQPFLASLAGTADVTAPFLVRLGSASIDPFAPFTLAASEPLPETATARLLAGDGSQVELLPEVTPGDVPFVTRFSKPDVVLRFGDGYAVTLDGLVDFAGHAGPTDVGLRLAGTPAPPLAAEDGFEAAGATVGGASVVQDPAVVIAGTRSLYVGGSESPLIGTIGPGASFAVRLAVQPGDTKVRFAARSVSRLPQAGFAGQVSIGSVGHASGVPGGVSVEGAVTNTVLLEGRAVYVTAPKTNELQLPADVSDEIVVSIKPSNAECGPRFAVGGLLIDDLRVE